MRFLLTLDADAPSKAAILEHALVLFVRDGLCETSIRDIADAAGYTNPALYKFFPSKDALALHLFDRCYGHVVAELARATEGDASYSDKMNALLAAFLRLIDDNLDAVLFANEQLRTLWRKLPAASRQRSILGLLRAVLVQGQRERAVRRDLDLSLALALITGTFAQVARMAYFDELPKPYARSLKALHTLMEGALC